MGCALSWGDSSQLHVPFAGGLQFKSAYYFRPMLRCAIRFTDWPQDGLLREGYLQGVR